MSKCVGCAKCCYSKLPMYKVLIDESEVEQFKYSNFIQDGLHFLKMIPFGDYKACIFLDKENFKCSIYDERPRVCKEFKEDCDFCKQLIEEK